MDQLTVRVDQLGERMDQLTVRIEQLGERMDQLTVRIDQLGERMDQTNVRIDHLCPRSCEPVTAVMRMDGRLGRLEGWRYEISYRENLASHLVRRFRRPKLLIAGNVQRLVDALDNGELTDEESIKVMAVDVLAAANDKSQPEQPESYVAIELSQVIDNSDVERAHERASILRRVLDQPVVACVDGEAILIDAARRAQELGVLNLRG